MGAKLKKKKTAKLKKGQFEIGIPCESSELRIVFKEPTVEEFDIEEYLILSERFLHYRKLLNGVGGETPADDIKLVKKAGDIMTDMAERVFCGMQATQVTNNNGKGKLDIRSILMGDQEHDELILSSYEDDGAVVMWVMNILPDEDELGN